MQKNFVYSLSFSFILLAIISSCSVERKLGQFAEKKVLQNAELRSAHVGIYIFDPQNNKQLYTHNAEKYFVPASNTKIPTCYAAMKYLGDSLVALRYDFTDAADPGKRILIIQPSGDPTYLHKDFSTQPAWNFLLQNAKRNQPILIITGNWEDDKWGSGWGWTDYEAAYMAERSSFPVYGNTISIKLLPVEQRQPFWNTGATGLFKTQHFYFDSLINKQALTGPGIEFLNGETVNTPLPHFNLRRKPDANDFYVTAGRNVFSNAEIPFVTNGLETAAQLLRSSLGQPVQVVRQRPNDTLYIDDPSTGVIKKAIKGWNTIRSQPTDSVLKIMMHRSDNFFAEQTLLMVGNEKLGVMNDAKVIDTLLKTDFSDLPQKPRWADGSGLSRYNLFTPMDITAILDKMKNEFGMERIRGIFPTGGQGTISSYYKADSGFIYGKTGTLSGVVAFSGYLYTRKGKLLIFSTLINNHQASATDIRRTIEKFLQRVRNMY